MFDYETCLKFFVNGKKITVENPDPSLTLLVFLRRHLRLTGTKLGCGEGGCGACTVMVSKFDHDTGKIRHFSVNACLAPVCSMHGLAVTTVEGIGSVGEKIHPVQERIAKAHGSQCGFCTPGIVMSMYTLLRNRNCPDENDLEIAFQGNLCRCTGYRSILEGYKTFTKPSCCNGATNGKCCMDGINGVSTDEDVGYEYKVFDSSEFKAYDPSQEPIFPSELQISDSFNNSFLKFSNKNMIWFRPTSLNDLLKLKKDYPEAKIVNGNTEIGVEVKFKHAKYPVIISATNIREMAVYDVKTDHIEIGAGVTLSKIDEELEVLINENKDGKNDIAVALREMLHWFAGPQIRNVAAIGGNIMTASPISDLIPVLVAQGTRLIFQSHDGDKRTISMNQSFFKGYRKLAVKPEEVLVSIVVPRTQESEYLRAYKQAHRREDDIAIVNAGMFVSFQEGTKTIKELRVCYGGMAPTCVVAKKTSSSFVGRVWDESLLTDVLAALEEDLPLPFGVPGGSEAYRRTLTLSFFYRFYIEISKELAIKFNESIHQNGDFSALGWIEAEPLTSSQLFDAVPKSQPDIDPVGRPIVHVNAFKQACGEAGYVDDMPRFENELYLGLVFGQRSHAKIKNIDYSAALAMDGVVTFVDNSDPVKCKTFRTSVLLDETVFADGKVVYYGHPIAGILAETQEQAQAAARAVVVDYEDLEPIVTIEDAIAANQIHDVSGVLVQGDIDKGFSNCDVIVEGETRTGAQEHFYLETQAALAIPREDNEICVYASSQNPTVSQSAIAEVLGIPSNRVEVKVKRCGGGFGGKETRNVPLTVQTAVAARKSGCPVRIMLDRDEDMIISGTRHPSLIKYKIGATKDGKIIAADITIYLNAGYSEDLSRGVLGRALFTSFSSFHIPNFRCKGYKCTTNLPSNTAFRGFGVPQAMFGAETWITHISQSLKMPAEYVREINFLKDGDMLPFGYPITHVHLQSCWSKCKEISNFEESLKQCEEYNRKNRWKKRGVAMTTVAYPCSYPIRFLNQSGALVHVYVDGSVLLSHGGIEMGQGLHTKTTQVASRVLGIPPDRIYIMETGTDKVANTSATAASFGTDLNANAVIDACQQIRKRLQPVIDKNPNGTWEEWINQAYLQAISLSAFGFFQEPDVSAYVDENGHIKGRIASYYTYGAGFSEVEIDCLTGDHVVRKVKIVMDIGSSLNPAIDIGQIEGAYMQGYGLYVLEETRHSPSGFPYTRGPGMYKLPGFGDVPKDFTVHLLHGARCEHPRAVYSSKAVGEPPLLLSTSTFCAIKEAIMAARKDSGLNGFFRLDSPATSERIRMACADDFTSRFPKPTEGSYKPWDVRL